MTPETADLLKTVGPPLVGAIAGWLSGFLGGVMKYGAIKAKVEGWDAVRKEDNDGHETADGRLHLEIEELRKDFDKDLNRQRLDCERSFSEGRRDADALRGSINGLGGRVNKLDREIGEAKAGAEKLVEAERHRIDEHAKRSEEQQRQNAEYYAAEAKRALERVEKLIAERA
jgi:hypothetical protein